ncbi:MAG: DUF1206 domain-containing protein, partial [Chthoniobacterales bacterium]|nr:DUF1206 domain-containing protein [Chthoniobacterales bacterium]
MAAPAQTRIGRRIEWLAVAGAVAQALLYCAIGVTAIRASIYVGDTPQNMAGVLKEMAAGLIGRTTVGFVALAFACIAAARLVEAWRGRVEHLGHTRAVAVRVWSAAVALIYGGLSMLALRFFFQPSAPADETTSDRAALAIAHPLGALGLRKHWRGHSRLRRTPAHYRASSARLSKMDALLWVVWPFLVRAVAVVMGGSAVVAAAFRSPGDARGVSGALTFLQHQLFGPVLLAGIGVGLLVFG